MCVFIWDRVWAEARKLERGPWEEKKGWGGGLYHRIHVIQKWETWGRRVKLGIRAENREKQTGQASTMTEYV